MNRTLLLAALAFTLPIMVANAASTSPRTRPTPSSPDMRQPPSPSGADLPPTIIECPPINSMSGVHVAVNQPPPEWRDGGGSFIPGIDLREVSISHSNGDAVDSLYCRYMSGNIDSLIFTTVRAGACVVSDGGKGKSFTCVNGAEHWKLP